jgi:hypothetical protein
MSCEQTTKAYEACREVFWDLMEDYGFQAKIYMNFLDSQQQWREKEFGFDEDPYDNFFDYLWKWDSEGMCRDQIAVCKSYLKGKYGKNI